MPVEANIIMDIFNTRERSFPREVAIERGVYIRFIVRVRQNFVREINIRRQLSFALYFEGTSPSGFQKRTVAEVSTGILQENLLYRAKSAQNLYHDVVIAEGDATEPGRYKYGIEANIGDEDIFDEDPILIIV